MSTSPSYMFIRWCSGLDLVSFHGAISLTESQFALMKGLGFATVWILLIVKVFLRTVLFIFFKSPNLCPLSPSCSCFLSYILHKHSQTHQHSQTSSLPSHSVISCPIIALAKTGPETPSPKPYIIHARGSLRWMEYSIKKDTVSLDLNSKKIGCDSYLFNNRSRHRITLFHLGKKLLFFFWEKYSRSQQVVHWHWIGTNPQAHSLIDVFVLGKLYQQFRALGVM